MKQTGLTVKKNATTSPSQMHPLLPNYSPIRSIMITKLYHNNGKNNHIRITYYMKNHKEDGE